jgi:hypothetical protein
VSGRSSLSPHQHAYLRAVRDLAAYDKCSPDTLSTRAKVRGVEARLRALVPLPYFQGGFPVPHALHSLAPGHTRLLSGLLCQTAAATLQTCGRAPQWPGGELGLTMALPTWRHPLEHHLQVPCVGTGGALAPHNRRWIPTARRDCRFPVTALSRMFRSTYLPAPQQAYRQGRQQGAGATASLAAAQTCPRFLVPLGRQPWSVYATPPFASAQQVVAYLGRYTHRVALSKARLVALREGHVALRWRDKRRGNRPTVMTLAATEVIRRFLLHVLPTGCMRLRHYGGRGYRCRPLQVATCRQLLAQPAPILPAAASAATMRRRRTGIDIERCPQCHQGRVMVSATLSPWGAPVPGQAAARPP